MYQCTAIYISQPWPLLHPSSTQLMARSFNALLSATTAPTLLPHDPFLHVSTGTLGLAVVTGRADITATSFTALAHARGPDAGPGKQSHVYATLQLGHGSDESESSYAPITFALHSRILTSCMHLIYSSTLCVSNCLLSAHQHFQASRCCLYRFGVSRC